MRSSIRSSKPRLTTRLNRYAMNIHINDIVMRNDRRIKAIIDESIINIVMYVSADILLDRLKRTHNWIE